MNQLSNEERLRSHRVIKFECRIVRKKANSNPYFVGVALKEGGGIDFYHNYTLVFSHDPSKARKREAWQLRNQVLGMT